MAYGEAMRCLGSAVLLRKPWLTVSKYLHDVKRRAGRRRLSTLPAWRRGSGRPQDAHSGAAPARRCINAERRAIKAHDLIDDGESKPGAGSAGPRRAVKPLQHAGTLGRSDSRAGVIDHQKGLPVIDARVDRDLASGRRVVERVIDQVAEHFLEQ